MNAPGAMTMSTRSTAVRIFISLWIVFCVHWATDFVREHFLVLSIVERQTFALDGFEDLHPDIFVHTDGHAYHGANPGISMVGAVPYFLLAPLVDRVAARELEARAPSDQGVVEYDDPRPARREFYAEVRARGLDVRFGLIGLITQVFANAPLSALGGAVFFLVLVGAGVGRWPAIGGTLLYALGTPVFMRSAYLNQNLAVGIFGLIGFALLWNPGAWCSWSRRTRWLLAGFCGGLALLSDYSGGLILALLGGYALLLDLDEVPVDQAVRRSLTYAVGAIPPVLMLWYYQWSAFGFPFYPPQHYMPPVEWSDLGYQGVGGPVPELFALLLLDPRFGLFVNAPVVMLAFASPFLAARSSFLPKREAWLTLSVFVAFMLLFSSVHYTRPAVHHGYSVPDPRPAVHGARGHTCAAAAPQGADVRHRSGVCHDQLGARDGSDPDAGADGRPLAREGLPGRLPAAGPQHPVQHVGRVRSGRFDAVRCCHPRRDGGGPDRRVDRTVAVPAAVGGRDRSLGGA